jgi:hypothetical protein
MGSGWEEAGEEAEWTVATGEDVECCAVSIDTLPMSYNLKLQTREMGAKCLFEIL